MFPARIGISRAPCSEFAPYLSSSLSSRSLSCPGIGQPCPSLSSQRIPINVSTSTRAPPLSFLPQPPCSPTTHTLVRVSLCHPHPPAHAFCLSCSSRLRISIIMSAPAETPAAAAPAEEVKSTETPAAEPAPAVAPKEETKAAEPAPAAEAPKEEAKAEVSPSVSCDVVPSSSYILGSTSPGSRRCSRGRR